MPFPLIPILLGGAALLVGIATGKKRTAVEPEAAPTGAIETRPGYAAALRQHDFAMSPAVTDAEYLRNVAEALNLAGFPELAEEVLEKANRMPGAPAGGVPAPPPLPPEPTPSTATPASPPVALPSTEPDESGVEVEPSEPGGGGEIATSMPPDGIPRAVPAPTEVPTPAPPIPHPAEIPPVASAETAPALDPNGTIALARLLIARESGSGWKTALQPEVRAWQGRVGFTGTDVDGKFGTGSAIRMGREVGTLPRIRFFSTRFYNKTDAVNDAKARIRALADEIEPTNNPQAVALRVSADAENGQGWPATATPVPTEQRSIEANQLEQLLDMLSREQAEREAGGSVPSSDEGETGYGTRTTEWA